MLLAPQEQPADKTKQMRCHVPPTDRTDRSAASPASFPHLRLSRGWRFEKPPTLPDRKTRLSWAEHKYRFLLKNARSPKQIPKGEYFRKDLFSLRFFLGRFSAGLLPRFLAESPEEFLLTAQ